MVAGVAPWLVLSLPAGAALDGGRQAGHMVDTARARGLFLMEAIWSRFLPAYRSLAEVIGEARIGEPLLVEADFGYRMPVQPGHRKFDRALGGGALLDLGIYPVQLCSLVLGPPGHVAAAGVVGETGVDEQVAAVLRHRGGRLGVVKAATRVGLACTARISGTEGWIDLPAFTHCPESFTVTTPNDGAERIDGSCHGDGLRFEIAEVHRCLTEGPAESPTMPLDETIALASTLAPASASPTQANDEHRSPDRHRSGPYLRGIVDTVFSLTEKTILWRSE